VHCPVCGLGLKMIEVQEFSDFTLVRRSCSHCRVNWVLKHQGDSIVSITQEGMEMGDRDYGFDYECPYCGRKSYVATVYQTRTGWKCISCGKIVPNKYLKPRGNFRLQEYLASTSTSKRGAKRVSTHQRSPRVSRPTPEGAVSLVQVASELKVEPKKLRSFLRKSNWRKSEESGSAWIFSPEEVEELKKSFRR